MIDWQVGDLGAGDNTASYCASCAAEIEDDPTAAGDIDGVHAVIFVSPVQHGETHVGLIFDCDPVGGHPWCACQFRKVVTDKREACEPEFVTLLKRSKRKVTAIAAAARQGGDVQQAPGAAPQSGDVQQAPGAAPQSGHEVASPKGGSHA